MIIVAGDTHGQLADVVLALRRDLPALKQGHPLANAYVFVGDFVDRGPHQVELVILLLYLAVTYPDHVTLLRGNHEVGLMQQPAWAGPAYVVRCSVSDGRIQHPAEHHLRERVT